jgi:hypothetical protein
MLWGQTTKKPGAAIQALEVPGGLSLKIRISAFRLSPFDLQLCDSSGTAG